VLASASLLIVKKKQTLKYIRGGRFVVFMPDNCKRLPGFTITNRLEHTITQSSLLLPLPPGREGRVRGEVDIIIALSLP